jgi:hypothetical protein
MEWTFSGDSVTVSNNVVPTSCPTPSILYKKKKSRELHLFTSLGENKRRHHWDQQKALFLNYN